MDQAAHEQKYDLIHAHHPIAGLAMKRIYPDVPLIQTLHSSYERELILNGLIREGGLSISSWSRFTGSWSR